MLMFPAVAQAANPGKLNIWDKLTDTSGKALQLTQQGKYAEAKQLLEYFEKQFVNVKQKKLHLSMKELRILTAAHDQALRAVTNVSAAAEDRVTAVIEFHLVVDALHSKNQPLWLSTKNQLFTPFYKMKQAAEQKDDRSFQFYLNRFLSKYEMIHPALIVDLKEPAANRLDSEIRYLMNHRSDFFSQSNYLQHLDQVEKDFRALYDGTLEDSMEPTLPWVIISIGGIIVVALFYSGWQKYKAEKRMREKKRKKVKKRSKF
jgi:sporulation protein YpjB